MGWLFDLVIDLVSDLVLRRIPAWGCALIVGVLVVAVLLVIWLT